MVLWLERLKKIFVAEIEEESLTEKISFEQLPQRLKERENEILEKSKYLKKEIEERSYLLERDLRGPIVLLENLNLDKRKEHEKIKFVVKENLHLYIFLLKKLTTRLKEISEERIQEYLEKVSLILQEFNSSAHLPFEKSTLLVGEEMRAPTAAVRAFAKDFKELAAKSQEMIEEIEKIHNIEELFYELKEKSNYVDSLSVSHKKIDSEIQRKREEIEVKRKNIERIKSSEEYRKELTLKESRAGEIENEIHLLRSKIDFKLLARCFHHDDAKNFLLKRYASNFKSALLEDEPLQILEMIKAAQNLDLEELRKIRARLSGVVEPFVSRSEQELFYLEDTLKKAELENSGATLRIQEELKKKEKTLLKIKKLESEVTSSAQHFFPKWEIVLQGSVSGK